KPDAKLKRLTWRIDKETDATLRQLLINEKKATLRRRLEIPSVDQYDPEYRRLKYCRYADDFVLGAICSKSEAEEIFRQIESFLKETLKLKISQEKSGIKHNTEITRFLGYDILIQHD